MKLQYTLCKGITVFACISFVLEVHAQNLSKVSDVVTTNYTNVGKIALTILNNGTLGTRNNTWPGQPSCEYPLGSRIEHMYQGGLWIGAKMRQGSYPYLVSTGVTDRAGSTTTDYEFSTEIGSTMVQRSSLSSSRYFQLDAISHQDFLADYTDRNTHIPQTGDSILNHHPIGLKVHQESYAWNFPFTENFVILSYTITNISADTLDDVYVGIWCDNVVRNTNFVRPGIGSSYFAYCGEGYDTSSRMMYTFEFNPYPGNFAADSYIGVALIGSTPFPSNVGSTSGLGQQTFYNIWNYRGGSGYPDLYSPTDDYNTTYWLSRYTRMSQSTSQTALDWKASNQPYGNYTTMISTGPWHIIPPGDSIQVVFTVVCANKDGSEFESKDTPAQKKSLNIGVDWAQRCYNGEDINGNDILDPGEDIMSRIPGGLVARPDGKLTRYVLPTPPAQPIVHAEVRNQRVTIYWDKSAERSRDPISGKYDFEGYRVYRTSAGADFLNSQNWLLNIPLVGDFDYSNDTIGYNTGLQKILIDTSSSFTGITFSGDTTHYFYQFPPRNVTLSQLNGWQYIYGVSAYDQGDLTNNLASLESAMTTVTAIAGSEPTSDPAKEIGVYPNPYYAHAYWDGTRERDRKIYFFNLPANATITIYTITGDVVAQLEHNSSSQGSDINWFKTFSSGKTPQFSGGEHAWDLISKYDQAVATGLYLFTVKDKSTGAIKRGKFVVIK